MNTARTKALSLVTVLTVLATAALTAPARGDDRDRRGLGRFRRPESRQYNHGPTHYTPSNRYRELYRGRRDQDRDRHRDSRYDSNRRPSYSWRGSSAWQYFPQRDRDYGRSGYFFHFGLGDRSNDRYSRYYRYGGLSPRNYYFDDCARRYYYLDDCSRRLYFFDAGDRRYFYYSSGDRRYFYYDDRGRRQGCDWDDISRYVRRYCDDHGVDIDIDVDIDVND
jgi:hypothetical protein